MAKDEEREKIHYNSTKQTISVFYAKAFLYEKGANIHTKQPLANSLSLNIL